MSSAETAEPAGSPAANEGEASARKQLAALLVCFTGRKAAAKARRPLVERLRAGGNTVVDT
jgi:hypothetical protein